MGFSSTLLLAIAKCLYSNSEIIWRSLVLACLIHCFLLIAFQYTHQQSANIIVKEIIESVNLWNISCCLFSQMHTEYKSISVSHTNTECLTDTDYLATACWPGSMNLAKFSSCHTKWTWGEKKCCHGMLQGFSYDEFVFINV